jgi:hypothetical protein
MAHPKRKISKQEEIREEHIIKLLAQIATCPITERAHLYHRAYWHVKCIVIDKSVAVA